MQIVFRPRAEFAVTATMRRDASFARAEAAVARWEQLFGVTSERTADFEDWHENAAQLLAAVDTGRPVFVMAPSGEGTEVSAVFNSGASGPDPVTPTLLCGAALTREPFRRARNRLDIMWPDTARAAAANAYASNPAFIRHAGRAVAVADISGTTEPTPGGIIEAVQNLAKAGYGDLLAKIVCRTKYSNPVPLLVPDADDIASIRGQLFEQFGYAFAHLEDEKDGLLIQERIPLSAEYRVIVVDGIPVAGAGCVESLSPPYNRGETFHPAVEGVRGDGNISLQPSLAARYAQRAAKIASDMAEKDGLFSDCTLDLGSLPDGRIALIEVNPLYNFGLYALNTGIYIDAAVVAAERRHAHRPADPSSRGP